MSIVLAANALKEKRQMVVRAEMTLQKEVAEFLDWNRGSMRDMAKEMGISAQYLCDIRHGRRKVSDAVVEKLAKLNSVMERIKH